MRRNNTNCKHRPFDICTLYAPLAADIQTCKPDRAARCGNFIDREELSMYRICEMKGYWGGGVIVLTKYQRLFQVLTYTNVFEYLVA